MRQIFINCSKIYHSMVKYLEHFWCKCNLMYFWCNIKYSYWGKNYLNFLLYITNTQIIVYTVIVFPSSKRSIHTVSFYFLRQNLIDVVYNLHCYDKVLGTKLYLYSLYVSVISQYSDFTHLIIEFVRSVATIITF